MYRRRPALHVERLERFGSDVALDQFVGALAEEDLPRLCRLFQPRCDVDRVAGGEGLPSRAAADEDVARIDADSDGELDAARLHELIAHGLDRVPELERRAHGPQGIVFVQLGHPIERDHGVTDEFLDLAPVALENLPASSE